MLRGLKGDIGDGERCFISYFIQDIPNKDTFSSLI